MPCNLISSLARGVWRFAHLPGQIDALSVENSRQHGEFQNTIQTIKDDLATSESRMIEGFSATNKKLAEVAELSARTAGQVSILADGEKPGEHSRRRGKK